jgi:SAM-dependent methyltransferase
VFAKSAAFYDALYRWKDYAAETRQLRDIIREHKQSPGDRLLDVACGTGQHLAHLREHYSVEGLDLDPGLIEIARGRLPGVTFHQADMRSFDLGQTFDVIVCLFSSIGYLKTADALNQAIATLARHAVPGGVVIVEPWFSGETFKPGHLGMITVDDPALKITRMNLGEVDGALSILNFHYLVGTPEGITHFTERHELGLFSHEQYSEAFQAAGLQLTYDEAGLMNRGLYIGVVPLS